MVNIGSDCCLTLSKQFFSHKMARTSNFLMRWWYLCCTRQLRQVGFVQF